jgi:predicted HAD superfamily Cof-like phosphohydrolase
MDPVFQEVHRSNLSKVGGYKRADGKWVKPPTYSPACLEPILNRQQAGRPSKERALLANLEEAHPTP